MRKITIFVAAIIALVVIAVLVLPALVPAERIKAELVAKVKAATGRDLAIEGKVSVSVLPTLSVQVAGVSLSNPPGYRGKELARLAGLEVKLKLAPLLSGRVEIDSFVVRQPAITLETDRSGRGNWVFGTATAKPAQPQPAASPAAKPESMAASALSDISLGDVRILGGTLTYLDDKGGAKETIGDIDLTLTLRSLDQPLIAKGGLTWHGQAVALALDVAKPRALMDGQSSAAGVSITAESLKLAFTGDLTAAGGATGALELSSPSLRGLAGWAGGKPLAYGGGGLGPLSIKARLAASGGTVALTQAALALDALKAAGEVSVVTGGARPALKGRLDVDALDLTPYLPPEGAAGGGSAAGKAPAGRADWSDEPIDASALKAADADFTLTAGAIKLRRLEIGRSALTLALHDGRLTADLAELSLYKGKGKGRVALDGAQAGGLGVTAAFSLKGLQAQPFLAAFGFDRLEGNGNGELQLAGRGASQRQIVSSLSGKGTVGFFDGAIRGINLAEMARNLSAAFADVAGSQK
ncbi:MAG: AsmA family protein, partial [Rhodospirillaceae bacterium]